MRSQPVEKNKSFVSALRYRSLTRFYDRLLRLTMPEHRIREALIRQAKVKTNDHILDLGCGSGTLTVMLKKRFPAAGVTGIDVDPLILEIAKEKATAALAYISLQVYDGEKLPFAAGSIDQVFSCLVFHHLYSGQKKTMLKELYRVMVRGAELHIADFGRSSSWLQRLLFYQIRLLDGYKNTAVNAPGVNSRC